MVIAAEVVALSYKKAEKKIEKVKEKYPPQIGIVIYADGDGIVTAAGGTTPYNYLWDNASTLSNPTNLRAGTHTVIVRDVNLCSITVSLDIHEPLPLRISASQTDSVKCSGGSNGAALAFCWRGERKASG